MPTIPTGTVERELRKLYIRWINGLAFDSSDLQDKISSFTRRAQALIEKEGGRTAMLGALGDFPAPKALDLSPHIGTIYTDMQKAAVAASITSGLNSKDAARQMFRAGMDKSYRRLERLARTETVSAYWKNAWGSVADLPALVMVWGSEDGKRTCPWCRERDGMVIDDDSIRDHPNGRCTPIPMLRSKVEYRGSVRTDGEIYWDFDFVKSQKAAVAPAQVQAVNPIPDVTPEQIVYARTTEERAGLLSKVYSNKTFGEFATKLSRVTPRGDGIVEIQAKVMKGKHEVGRVMRTIKERNNGTFYISHDHMELDEAVRGQGFSTQFSKYSEEWYRAAGIDTIKVHAGLSDGGYTWAKAGYVFDQSAGELIEGVLPHIYQQLNAIDKLDKTPEVLAGKVWLEQLEAKISAANSAQLRGDAAARKAAWDSLPQPWEIANASIPGIPDLGKKLLKGTDWPGKKELK